MRAEDLALLRELRIFSSVPEQTVSDLLQAGYFQLFPPGVTLIQERERADFLHVVVDGLVELYASHEDAETTMEIVRPVGVFILAAVLIDQAYLQSARTLARSRILMVPAERVRHWMAKDAAFTLAITKELARGYRQAIRGLKNQKLRTGAERLANWLLAEAAAHGDGGAFELDIEKRVVASRLGMTPENLSRAFATLAAHGVHSRGPRIEIARIDALRGFARPDPLIDGTD
jgi:CRP/FNR family transcriptional regulator, transcriptional activator FtrB